MDDGIEDTYNRWVLIFGRIEFIMAYIKALSLFSPSKDRLVDNEQLQEQFDVDIAKIAKGVGVNQRYIAAEDETASDLAYEATIAMLDEWHIDRSTIDFIIFSTQSPDYFLPSTACVLQHRLGLPTTIGAFDFDLGCSGYAYGLAIANSFVESGLAHNVLLLTGDTISKYLHPKDKNRVLFGDYATASIISSNGFAEIGQTIYGTDGSGAETIIVKNRGTRYLATTGREHLDELGNVRRDDYFYMNGEQVFNFTIDRVPQLINELLQKNNLTKEDVDYYVFHQANRFMLNTIRKVCGIQKTKFYVNIENTGNTTSSTIPIGLKTCMDNNVIHKGQKVMVAGFGVGLSWAATILKF